MIDLAIGQPLLFVLHKLYTNGYEAAIVGGAVRDLMMARAVNDWDITTNAIPDKIQKIFPHSFYDNAFGTVGIPLEHLMAAMKKEGWHITDNDPDWTGQVIEVTTYRTEAAYSDKRRPDEVYWGTTIEEDLARRDFTINAMALSLPQKSQKDLQGLLAFAQRERELSLKFDVIDPFVGKADLDEKLIKAVGNAEERFDEDALRMMRAIRFGAQLGFQIENTTFGAIQKKSHLIKHVSWERIRDELLKILGSEYPADGIMLLYNAGLLEYIMPEMLAMREVQQGGHHIYDVWTHSIEALRNCASTDPIVRLATLLHDIGKPKSQRFQGPRGVTFYGHEVIGARMVREMGLRLRLSNKEIDKLTTLVRWHMFTYDSDMSDSAIKRFIRRVGLENINDMMLLRVGDRKGGGSKATSWRLRELQRRIGENLYEPMSLKDLKIDGNDIMDQLNIKPGPKIGEILNQLFEEVTDDKIENEKETLLERARKLI